VLSLAWGAFDLVGLTERFDEFMLLFADLVGLQAPSHRRLHLRLHLRLHWPLHEFMLLFADLVGLQAPAYRMQQVATETLAASKQQQARGCPHCAEMVGGAGPRLPALPEMVGGAGPRRGFHGRAARAAVSL
jgi:hypothetical protein